MNIKIIWLAAVAAGALVLGYGCELRSHIVGGEGSQGRVLSPEAGVQGLESGVQSLVIEREVSALKERVALLERDLETIAFSSQVHDESISGLKANFNWFTNQVRMVGREMAELTWAFWHEDSLRPMTSECVTQYQVFRGDWQPVAEGTNAGTRVVAVTFTATNVPVGRVWAVTFGQRGQGVFVLKSAEALPLVVPAGYQPAQSGDGFRAGTWIEGVTNAERGVRSAERKHED